MQLICYPTGGTRCTIRPASPSRGWMDRLPQRFAYRCLPLTIANGHGWEILSPSSFEVRWEGGSALADVQVKALDDDPGYLPASHFGHGVLTFQTGYLFATEPGYNLWVTGPPNYPKDGILALSGVVETDWSPYPFTMSWQFTRAGVSVRFQEGEPFCFFFPVPRGLLGSVSPEFRDFASVPEKKRQHDEWARSREEFLHDLPLSGTTASREQWQKLYFQGLTPDGAKGTSGHQTSLHIREFDNRCDDQS